MISGPPVYENLFPKTCVNGLTRWIKLFGGLPAQLIHKIVEQRDNRVFIIDHHNVQRL